MVIYDDKKKKVMQGRERERDTGDCCCVTGIPVRFFFSLSLSQRSLEKLKLSSNLFLLLFFLFSMIK